jgi:hypothetical protein
MDRRNIYKLRHLKKKVFIETYRQVGNITVAAETAGVSRPTYYVWMEHDESFALAVREAEIEAVERLEEEARRRAVEGVRREEGVFYKGIQIATKVVTEYSDTLLIFLLKGAKPEKYKDRQELSGKVSIEVQKEMEAALDRLRAELDGETYKRVLAALAAG